MASSSIGYSDSGIGDDMTCISIDVECEDYYDGSSGKGKGAKGKIGTKITRVVFSTKLLL